MLDQKFSRAIQQRIDQKTKPLGALGELEQIALQLALIQSQGRDEAVTEIVLSKPTMLVFAGDHGIADEGVSIAPSVVTQQMVANFLSGGAAINCFCRINNINFKVIDCGILQPVESTSSALLLQRLGCRTENFSVQAAMPSEVVEKGIQLGRNVAQHQIEGGCNVLMFGEMGIGNTSSAAAILSALSGHSANECVGYGTGITDEQLEKKASLVAKGVSRCKSDDVLSVLSEVGGYEIVQIVGAILQAAKQNVPMLIDGFIVSAAAYAATRIDPQCREWMVFAHRSEEQGHKLLLAELNAKPLLDMGLRLGEGTGAALAFPMLQAAAEFYNHMASFDSAGVTV